MLLLKKIVAYIRSIDWWVILVIVLVGLSIGIIIDEKISVLDGNKGDKKEIVLSVREQIEKIEIDTGKLMSIKEKIWYLLDKEYGLSFDERIDAMAVIRCESQFNQYAIHINKNGSLDLGLWQINEPSHDLSRECMFDIYCSTEYAIKGVYLKDKNWKQWVCKP